MARSECRSVIVYDSGRGRGAPSRLRPRSSASRFGSGFGGRRLGRACPLEGLLALRRQRLEVVGMVGDTGAAAATTAARAAVGMGQSMWTAAASSGCAARRSAWRPARRRGALGPVRVGVLGGVAVAVHDDEVLVRDPAAGRAGVRGGVARRVPTSLSPLCNKFGFCQIIYP